MKEQVTMSRSMLFAILLLILSSSPAPAADLFEDKWSPVHNEMASARALAMGRAFISIAETNTAYFFNPAGVAQKNLYSIGIDSEFNTKGDSMAFHASIIDSATSPLCVQVGYTFHQYNSIQLWNGLDRDIPIDYEAEGIYDTDWIWLENTLDYDENNRVYPNYYEEIKEEVDWPRAMFGKYKRARIQRHIPRLALAGAISRNFFMGGTVKYLYASRPGRHSVNSANIDVGAMYKADFGLRIGLAGYNLIHTAYDMWPLTLGMGVGYSIDDVFYISYDQIVVFNVFQEKNNSQPQYGIDIKFPEDIQLAYRAGVEYIAGGVVPIRAGYEYDGTRGDHNVSGGLAYKHEFFSLNVGFSVAANNVDNTLINIGFDFIIP